MSGASVSKSFGNRLSFFLVAWFGFCSAEKQQSFHEFVFAWHVFCFAEKLRELSAEKLHAAVCSDCVSA